MNDLLVQSDIYSLLSLCLSQTHQATEKEFIAFMCDNSLHSDLKKSLEAWKDHCIKNNLSASTVNNKMGAVKRLFKRAMEKDKSITVDLKNKLMADMNEIKKLKAPRPQVQNKILTESEMVRFLDQAEKLNPEIALMSEFLWSTGLRISEMLSIKLANIKQISSAIYEIRIIGKGSKERSTYIDISLYKAIIKFFKPSEYFFQKKKKRIRSRSYVSMNIKRLCARILDRRNLAAHSLRHSYATNGLEKGRSLQWVSQALGHSDIQTTSRYYAHISVRPQEVIDTVKLDRSRTT